MLSRDACQGLRDIMIVHRYETWNDATAIWLKEISCHKSVTWRHHFICDNHITNFRYLSRRRHIHTLMTCSNMTSWCLKQDDIMMSRSLFTEKKYIHSCAVNHVVTWIFPCGSHSSPHIPSLTFLPSHSSPHIPSSHFHPHIFPLTFPSSHSPPHIPSSHSPSPFPPHILILTLPSSHSPTPPKGDRSKEIEQFPVRMQFRKRNKAGVSPRYWNLICINSPPNNMRDTLWVSETVFLELKCSIVQVVWASTDHGRDKKETCTEITLAVSGACYTIYYLFQTRS